MVCSYLYSSYLSSYSQEYLNDSGHYVLPCRDIPRDTLYITCIIVTTTVIFNGSTVPSKVLDGV